MMSSSASSVSSSESGGGAANILPPLTAPSSGGSRCLYDNDESKLLLPAIIAVPLIGGVIGPSTGGITTTGALQAAGDEERRCRLGETTVSTTSEKLNKYSDKANQLIPAKLLPHPSSSPSSPMSSAAHESSNSTDTSTSSAAQVVNIQPFSNATTAAAAVGHAADRPTTTTTTVDGDSYVQKHSAGICLVRRLRRVSQQTRVADGIPSSSSGLESLSSSPSDATGVDTDAWQALVIRRGKQDFYELPKGHVEYGESLTEAAEREIREETGLKSSIAIGKFLTSERYIVRRRQRRHDYICPKGITLVKCVWYFRARSAAALPVTAPCPPTATTTTALHTSCSDGASVQSKISPLPGFADDEFEFGPRESATTEVRWLSLCEVDQTFLKSKQVREAIVLALTSAWADIEDFGAPADSGCGASAADPTAEVSG